MDMRLENFGSYVTEKVANGLTEITNTITIDPDTNDRFITKTKEVYLVTTKEEGDALIEDAVQKPTCVGHAITFKEGKTNKQGDVVRPDLWKVVLQFKF